MRICMARLGTGYGLSQNLADLRFRCWERSFLVGESLGGWVLIERELAFAAVELGLETSDDGRVHLGDP